MRRDTTIFIDQVVIINNNNYCPQGHPLVGIKIKFFKREMLLAFRLSVQIIIFLFIGWSTSVGGGPSFLKAYKVSTFYISLSKFYILLNRFYITVNHLYSGFFSILYSGKQI